MRLLKKTVLFCVVVVIGVAFSLGIYALSSLNVDGDDLIPNNNLNDAIYESNRFTQKDSTTLNVDNPLVKVEDNYQFVCEDNYIRLYVDEETLGIRVVDLKSGYVWGSSFTTQDERLNKTWRARVDSAIWITYYHKTAVRDELKEEAITSSGLSKIDFRKKSDGFEADIKFGESKICLSLNVKIENGTLKVDIPYDSIVETEDNFLSQIKVYPFFGAVKALETAPQIEGYTVIPDGSGALIRYKENTENPYPIYSKNVYGRDLGIYNSNETSTVYEDTKVSVPIIGFVHGINRNAAYVEAKSGDMYARIVSYQGGKITDFYWTTFEFVYRIQYQKRISQQNAITATQERPNEFDINLEYEFLNDKEANYLGIANDYHDKLFTNQKASFSSVPLRVEILNSEIEKGTLFDKVISMTTTEETLEIIDEINEYAKDVSLVMRGWSKKGHSVTSPSYFGFNLQTGGKAGYEKLFTELSDRNINYYLSVDYTKGFANASGYSSMSDLAQKITGSSIDGYVGDYAFSYLNPEASLEIYLDDLKKYQKYPDANLCFETLADVIYSNWDNDNETSLAQTIDIYCQMLNSTNASSYGSNKYAYLYAKELYNIPMYSSQIGIFTDTIPLISLIIKNSVIGYSDFINNFSDLNDEVLRLIDFNVFPSILLTKESAVNLVDTPSNYIVSSKYDSWKNELKNRYLFINEALIDTLHSKLISREILVSGVVKNTYENGKFIVINYLDQQIKINDITLEANSYKVGDNDEI